MTQIDLTTELLGDLGELYFRHLCIQRGYGYLRLEDLHRTLPNKVLEFKFLYERIPISIPFSIVDELTRVSTPVLVNDTKSFVFDFLTCKVYQEDSTRMPNSRSEGDFCWVEIKTGKSRLSNHQYRVARTCKMRFSIFRIKDVMVPPDEIQIEWEFDSRRRFE